MAEFIINKKTVIKSNEISSRVLEKAIERFYRDLNMTLLDTSDACSTIELKYEELESEQYRIKIVNNRKLIVTAKDDLGYIYAMLYLSNNCLGISPFWFWNDCEYEKVLVKKLTIDEYISEKPRVRYRGWFINDEVLIDKWSVNGSFITPWEMAFEALLRLGGNMVIPGTDKNSKIHRELAASMGLYITHHHAEPLGAEMFARKYPHLNPSFDEHPDLFLKLWEEGIEEQKDLKIIWNLGFRGQGDCPFWESDKRYNTSKMRGELISSLIKKQYDLLHSKFENPICCTNLYGESMELYKEGHLTFPEDVIKIWADNGYGKMVSRRQGNNNPRVYALPERQGKEHHGIYYHASFYDLQAANHMTMQPNSLAFINKELEHAFSVGAHDYLIVNCSNIKPHVYYLDAISKIWTSGSINVEEESYEYIRRYFLENKDVLSTEEAKVIQSIHECYEEYAKSTILFGPNEDEHAGEQFYNYTTRILASNWFKGEYNNPVNSLKWACDKPFGEQVEWFLGLCMKGLEGFSTLNDKCSTVYSMLNEKQKILFEDSIWLQVRIHLYCLKGSIDFCNSFLAFKEKKLYQSFFLLGRASEEFYHADKAMRDREHDKWDMFYANDCLCDIKQTAYVLKPLMAYVRNIGDGPSYYKWQREYLYEEEDKRVVLLTNTENHLTDEELYGLMKEKQVIS